MRTFLVRGMLAGLLAGVCVFVFYKMSGESAIDSSIRFETSKVANADAVAMPDLVGRNVQSTVGLAAGTSLIGSALGGFSRLLLRSHMGASVFRMYVLTLSRWHVPVSLWCISCRF